MGRGHGGGGPLTAEIVAGGVVAIAAALIAGGRWCHRHFSTRGIESRLEGLHGQVVSWQAAHDHQVEGIDRRLRDVEASAARAENEARIVSAQLTDLTRSLLARLEQVEHRLVNRRHTPLGRARRTTTTTRSGVVAGAGR